MLNLFCSFTFTTSMTDVFEGLIDVMEYGWHLSGRDANNCIGTTLYRSNHDPRLPLTP
jgi:hypothetical protein